MHSRLRKYHFLRRLRRRAEIRRLGRNERGVQLAELAIVLPVLLILFGATAEFGRYFYEYTTLAKAARIGTRYLITADVSTVEYDNAKNLVVFGNTAGTGAPLIDGLTVDHVIVTAKNSDDAVITEGVPQTITVEISGFKHKTLFDLGGLIKKDKFSLNLDVKPSVTMRYLLTTPLV
ncbi:MAG TPA: TadE family protein [Pyrinomonadaceae bacterium]|nr:TadE family protein [Pyrinomonadaceae bacterium]